MSQKTRILIADDHPIFRNGLRQVLEGDQNIQVIHESCDGEDALSNIEKEQPDIAVVDIEMPGMTGLDVLRGVKEKKLGVRIIILTMYTQEEMVDEAFDLGVSGYVLKQNAVLDILQAVRAVGQGDYYISPQISNHIMRRVRHEGEAKNAVSFLKDLTDTEKRILRLISMSKTSKEIADELFINSRTVDNHRTNICAKLNLHGPHKLLLFALENKDKL